MFIDAEVHFWKYAKSLQHPLIQGNKSLQQQYLPDNIEQSLNRNKIDGCIAVAAEPAEVETRFLAELAKTHPIIRGVVGWLDFSDPKAAEKIREFKQYSPIRGYRIEPLGNASLPAPEIMEILTENQYTMDLSLDAHPDISRLSEWMKLYPEQPFILESCGNPNPKLAPSPEWKTTILELSKNKRLSCKVSGLFERSHSKTWKPADFYPYLEFLFDAFGAGRLLYASDWPFLQLSGIYVQWKSLLEKFMEKFPKENSDLFFGDNAVSLYRL